MKSSWEGEINISVQQIAAALVGEQHEIYRSEIPPDFLHGEPKLAAVLVPFLKIDSSWHLLFIRRTHVDGDMHSGQVAFPGGGTEPGDDSLEATALREANEEIGLLPDQAQILGRLGTLQTVSNYIISPIVGILEWPQTLTPSPVEVSRIFTIPLDWLADPHNHYIELRTLPRAYPPAQVIYFNEFDGELLWGATARITLHLLETLGLSPRPN